MSRPRPGRAADEPVAFVGERLRTSGPLRAMLRYVFPDHWSFLLGEMALYSFMVLVATGVFLALVFDATSTEVVWHGPYAPLDGTRVSGAYASGLDLSFKVPGGLLLRQTHHWAALVFLVSIVLHLLRIFYTAAFRRPRELNYLVGVTLMGVAILEGYVGYSLLDDLLSGMGLSIGYGAALSIPGVGGALGSLIWDGPFPGGSAFLPRLFFVHVFLLPALIATLIGVHLAMIVRPHHTQFRGPGRREDNVVGSPLWAGYALRSLGMLASVAAVLVLLGAFVQINPIWEWGPYQPWLGENGAQPDWYLGWLIGALRLMPNVEISVFGRTLVPNPFFGGLLFPTVVFLTLYAWPLIEERVLNRGDRRQHHLLDRPRDNPRRTAFATAFLTWVATVFFAGSADRLFLAFGVSYELQVRIFRVLFFAAPVMAYIIARRVCLELRKRPDGHPLRDVDGAVVRRAPDGRFVADDERVPS
ncbi:MAG: ubiquinol-cytochrome c reductase cytochrome b subunit [Baekduia sp.]|jgi:ubiquinol-cytochrome c reductase cytochrome b subunit|nr:ubiquinol-cytochrome c reductase cytochrome b subunit [Baekduia sp.]